VVGTRAAGAIIRRFFCLQAAIRRPGFFGGRPTSGTMIGTDYFITLGREGLGGENFQVSHLKFSEQRGLP
jgi:hypothetical protein